MAEKRLPLQFAPGLYRAGTKYQSQGRWYDGNLVRFVADTKRPVGGWRRFVDHTGAELATLDGVPRGAFAWTTDGGGRYVAVGTTEKLYVIAGGILTDITPVGFTPGREKTTIPQPGASSTRGSKYGEGLYGVGRYGEGSSVGTREDADTWQLDTFGDYLAGVCTSDRKLYVWENNLLNPAAVPAGAPSSARAVVTTPEGFLFALGADGNGRLVMWPDQATFTEWTPAVNNAAGDWELATEGQLLCGHRTRRETLLFTTTDLWTATYIGGSLIYRFDQAGKKCGLISPRAAAAFDTEAYWMSNESFYAYDGFVRPIPCDVHDLVFSDMNKLQVAKIWAVTNAQFGEVTWYYCSAASEEIDRYVTFNHREKHWTAGRLERTAGVDAGALQYQTLITSAGVVYEHEVGEDRDGERPYLESGPIELIKGDNVMDVLGIIPDEKTLGDVEITIIAQFEPMGEEEEFGPFTVGEITDCRFSARQVRVRLTEKETDAPVSWRVGTPRLLVSPAGSR